jgi:tRNA dimethylallyltransferase
MIPTMPAIPRALALVGPTAAGKSGLGLQIARRFGSTIACCDSVQVYRGLDIGSAKPSAIERSQVPHTLLDLVDPDVEFSAGDYARAVHVRPELAAGRTLFVGGTGLYLRAAAWTSSVGAREDAARDDPARQAFEARWGAAEREQPGATHRALAAVDAETAARIHPRNVVRTLRALWLCERGGEPVSAQRRRNPPRPRIDVLTIVLDPGPVALEPAIRRRCDAMLAAGWLAEVEKLVQAGYDARCKAMRTLGYRELLAVVEGRTDLAPARDEIVRATRAYSRRQRTFFRHQLPAARTRYIDAPDRIPWAEIEAFIAGGTP